MNRKERRAASKRGPSLAVAPDGVDTEALMEVARQLRRQGRFREAEDVCGRILARVPAHVPCLNLLGLLAQASGRHAKAVKSFSAALAADASDAPCRFNLAHSYLALGRTKEAKEQFVRAIALGAGDNKLDELILQNRAIALGVERLENAWPLPLRHDQVFGPAGLASVAGDLFLRCVLETVPLSGMALEIFLTQARSAVLQLALHQAATSASAGPDVEAFACTLAQQCFINEYVFGQSAAEIRSADELRGIVVDRLSNEGIVPVLMLAALACYGPLGALPEMERLHETALPESVAGLLRQQVYEPSEEARDGPAIPVLTSVDDHVSIQVMRQYEANPYPRWTVDTMAGQPQRPSDAAKDVGDILVAGCGTGQHVFQVAHWFPNARILAVDISRPSLAYARRKAREAGLRQVEFAQADILKLGEIGRRFDRIESVGVLHHLADPVSGWRILLSLLRPGGQMRVGLYSELARQPVADARAFAGSRFSAAADDIRRFRQEILHSGYDSRWRRLVASADFYTMSGCRDLLFNVMEHRFSIPAIKAFIEGQGLSFAGFEISPAVATEFTRRFSASGALSDLDAWAAFEAAQPETFWNMYVFSVRKPDPAATS
jgi:SAM-dependent methyltransferase/tetratricopeptide (TPR) repeat protein